MKLMIFFFHSIIFYVGFNYVVCSIEESNNINTMTIDELQSSLLMHKQ